MTASNRIRPRATFAGRLVAGLALVVIGLAAAAPAAPAPPAASARGAAAAPTALVTGANRGLGLEFARQLHERGWEVIGTARRPDEASELKALGVRVEQLDVTEAASVARLAKQLEGRSLDLLVNNAGIGQRVQSLAEVDVASVERVLQVNYLGPVRVTQALLPALQRGERKLIVNITSGLGSIENNTGGGYYGYRESKAALNMFTRSIAAELRPAGFTCITMSPGWVRTDMGGSSATLSPEESIGGMLNVLDRLTPDDTGRFFSHTGEAVPW